MRVRGMDGIARALFGALPASAQQDVNLEQWRAWYRKQPPTKPAASWSTHGL